jgi:C-terminal processing protease CtpA/Prc
VTDGEGRFVLPGVGSGLQSILVAAAGHHGRLISGIEAGPGLDVGPITEELTPMEADEQPRIELEGIGAVLSAKGDALVIGRVIEGGGAAEAGLVPGDAIVAVEGRSVVDLGFQGSIERIRGPEGSVVQLSVRKAGQDEPVTLAVPRRRIRS